MRLLNYLFLSIITILTYPTFVEALTIISAKSQHDDHPTLGTHSTGPISTTPHHRLTPRQLQIWTPKFEYVVLAIMPIYALPLYYELLSALYTSILDTILNTIASKPSINQLVIEAGNLRWEFGCAIADPNIDSNGATTPLPPRFVEEYFESKRGAVERGFASVYEKAWWWEKVDGERGRERVCFAGMRVVKEGGVVVPPARG
ncbi:MAG: hypothetical protein L6R36_004354 [Xanthoria steineri]|nr:MAG: hypothetical protein L6R36_004354 [Xanthoria steineri]